MGNRTSNTVNNYEFRNLTLIDCDNLTIHNISLLRNLTYIHCNEYGCDECKTDKNEEEKYIIPDEKYKNLDVIKEKELECPICCSVINGTVAITKCFHRFCLSCLNKSQKRNNSCPICRQDLNVLDSVIISDTLTTFLNNSIVSCRYEECKVELCRKDMYNHIEVCRYKNNK